MRGAGRGVQLPKSARLLVFSLAAFFAAGSLGAASSFDEGERLFREDKPKDAVAYLEKAVTEPGTDERAWLYLGLAYQQLGRLDDAAQAFRKGGASSSRFRHLFLFDLGNVYLLQGKNSFAAEMYGEAIEASPSLADAYLNRANARIAVKEFPLARDDYRKYLELVPDSSQRAAIEELIRRLEGGIAEATRLAAEAEAKRIADEEARKALLDQVAASLKAAADETTSLSSGSGAVQGYNDELQLED